MADPESLDGDAEAVLFEAPPTKGGRAPGTDFAASGPEASGVPTAETTRDLALSPADPTAGKQDSLLARGETVGARARQDPARPSRTRTRAEGPRPAATKAGNAGRDLERRVGRVEFAEGALVRLRAPIRIDADSGRDVLTDIDVLAIDVDGRLRVSLSILECKSAGGQAKEPDRLLWLAGLQKYLGFERAVLVRPSVSRRGRSLARALGLKILDVERLSTREAAHAWLPEAFAHIDGSECMAAEARTEAQLKGLGHIPADLIAYLRHDALRSDSPDALRAVANLGRVIDLGGVLPSPAREVISAHATLAVLAAATRDAVRLDELSREELRERTERALTTGSPDSTQMLNVLARADDLVAHMLDRVHAAYEGSGANRVRVELPSLLAVVTRPPQWVPHYLDLVQKLRANPTVGRDILQTAELACFEALLGGSAHLAGAFDHLFTAEHRHLLNVAIRCLEAIAGAGTADPVRPILALDFDRMVSHLDRTAPTGTQSLSEHADLARPAVDPDS